MGGVSDERQGKAADDDAGSGEGLLSAIILSAEVKGRVEFGLDPEEVRGVVLDGVVEHEGAA